MKNSLQWRSPLLVAFVSLLVSEKFWLPIVPVLKIPPNHPKLLLASNSLGFLLTADEFHEAFQRNGLWLCHSAGCVWVLFFWTHHWLTQTRDKAANSSAATRLTKGPSESALFKETQSALKRALTTAQRPLQSVVSAHALERRADSPQTDGSQWQRFCLFQSVHVLTQKGLFGWSNKPVND